MEHFNSENLAVFLLAGFSSLSLFKRAMAWMMEVVQTVHHPKLIPQNIQEKNRSYHNVSK